MHAFGVPLRVPCLDPQAIGPSRLYCLQVVAKAADIQKSIAEGASSFLATEYYYLGIFMVRMPTLSRDPC